MRPTPQTSVLLKGEYRRRLYQDTDNAPTASDRTGNEYRLGAYGSYISNPNLMFNVGVQQQWTTAEQDYLSYSETAVYAGPTWAFTSPIDNDTGPWTVNLTVGATLRNYDAPDTLVSTTESQSDTEAFARTALTIPVKDNWSVLTEVEYRNTDSNYDLRKQDNASVTLSVIKRF